MTTQFKEETLKICVAQLCQVIGFQGICDTPLDVLTDLLNRYLKELTTLTHRYTEHYGRTQPMLGDLDLAFQQMGISLPDLEEYATCVDSPAFPYQLPQLPVPRQAKLNFLKPGAREILARPIHIHEHLPPMYPEMEDENEIKEELMNTSFSEDGEPSSPIPDVAMSPGGHKRPLDPSTQPLTPVKRLKQAAESEGQPLLREIDSVMMTTSGFISSAREGKMPESKPPANLPPLPTVTIPSTAKKAMVEKLIRQKNSLGLGKGLANGRGLKGRGSVGVTGKVKKKVSKPLLPGSIPDMAPGIVLGAKGKHGPGKFLDKKPKIPATPPGTPGNISSTSLYRPLLSPHSRSDGVAPPMLKMPVPKDKFVKKPEFATDVLPMPKEAIKEQEIKRLAKEKEKNLLQKQALAAKRKKKQEALTGEKKVHRKDKDGKKEGIKKIKEPKKEKDNKKIKDGKRDKDGKKVKEGKRTKEGKRDKEAKKEKDGKKVKEVKKERDNKKIKDGKKLKDGKKIKEGKKDKEVKKERKKKDLIKKVQKQKEKQRDDMLIANLKASDAVTVTPIPAPSHKASLDIDLGARSLLDIDALQAGERTPDRAEASGNQSKLSIFKKLSKGKASTDQPGGVDLHDLALPPLHLQGYNVDSSASKLESLLMTGSVSTTPTTPSTPCSIPKTPESGRLNSPRRGRPPKRRWKDRRSLPGVASTPRSNSRSPRGRGVSNNTSLFGNESGTPERPVTPGKLTENSILSPQFPGPLISTPASPASSFLTQFDRFPFVPAYSDGTVPPTPGRSGIPSFVPPVDLTSPTLRMAVQSGYLPLPSALQDSSGALEDRDVLERPLTPRHDATMDSSSPMPPMPLQFSSSPLHLPATPPLPLTPSIEPMPLAPAPVAGPGENDSPVDLAKTEKDRKKEHKKEKKEKDLKEKVKKKKDKDKEKDKKKEKREKRKFKKLHQEQGGLTAGVIIKQEPLSEDEAATLDSDAAAAAATVPKISVKLMPSLLSSSAPAQQTAAMANLTIATAPSDLPQPAAPKLLIRRGGDLGTSSSEAFSVTTTDNPPPLSRDDKPGSPELAKISALITRPPKGTRESPPARPATPSVPPLKIKDVKSNKERPTVPPFKIKAAGLTDEKGKKNREHKKRSSDMPTDSAATTTPAASSSTASSADQSAVASKAAVSGKKAAPATQPAPAPEPPVPASVVVADPVGPIGHFVDDQGNEVWICPTCGKQDDGSPMIGCDTCNDWYHWVCVGIQVPPSEDENWYCPRCLSQHKQRGGVTHAKKRGRRRK